MSEEIKHCPCCNGEAREYLQTSCDCCGSINAEIYCAACGIGITHRKTLEEATSIWNTRYNEKETE